MTSERQDYDGIEITHLCKLKRLITLEQNDTNLLFWFEQCSKIRKYTEGGLCLGAEKQGQEGVAEVF